MVSDNYVTDDHQVVDLSQSSSYGDAFTAFRGADHGLRKKLSSPPSSIVIPCSLRRNRLTIVLSPRGEWTI